MKAESSASYTEKHHGLLWRENPRLGQRQLTVDREPFAEQLLINQGSFCLSDH